MATRARYYEMGKQVAKLLSLRDEHHRNKQSDFALRWEPDQRVLDNVLLGLAKIDNNMLKEGADLDKLQHKLLSLYDQLVMDVLTLTQRLLYHQ